MMNLRNPNPTEQFYRMQFLKPRRCQGPGGGGGGGGGGEPKPQGLELREFKASDQNGNLLMFNYRGWHRKMLLSVAVVVFSASEHKCATHRGHFATAAVSEFAVFNGVYVSCGLI